MKKTYKWIVMFCVFAVICVVGNVLNDRYESRNLMEGLEPVDYETFNVQEEIAKADESRKQYVIKVNINTASVEELTLLPKIGELTAEKIVEYRNSYGDFINIEEIKSVEGIGDKTFDALRDYIVIE